MPAADPHAGKRPNHPIIGREIHQPHEQRPLDRDLDRDDGQPGGDAAPEP